MMIILVKLCTPLCYLCSRILRVCTSGGQQTLVGAVRKLRLGAHEEVKARRRSQRFCSLLFNDGGIEYSHPVSQTSCGPVPCAMLSVRACALCIRLVVELVHPVCAPRILCVPSPARSLVTWLIAKAETKRVLSRRVSRLQECHFFCPLDGQLCVARVLHTLVVTTNVISTIILLVG